MKVAIMATGGVGGYFGARLAAAGQEVHFIARGAHLAALRANGLRLKSANGDLHLQGVSATDNPAAQRAPYWPTPKKQSVRRLRLTLEAGRGPRRYARSSSSLARR